MVKYLLLSEVSCSPLSRRLGRRKYLRRCAKISTVSARRKTIIKQVFNCKQNLMPTTANTSFLWFENCTYLNAQTLCKPDKEIEEYYAKMLADIYACDDYLIFMLLIFTTVSPLKCFGVILLMNLLNILALLYQGCVLIR